VAIVALLLLQTIAFTVAFLYMTKDLLESTSFPVNATHVPTFYVPLTRHQNPTYALLLMALASIFGSIHFAGWNLPFPTVTEQKLWHFASLAVTIIPIALFLITFIIIKFLLAITKSSSGVKEFLVTQTFVISILAYASARLVLFGLALALLRQLPPSAYIAINWTKLYPHIHILSS